jgi:hypothetical protein
MITVELFDVRNVHVRLDFERGLNGRGRKYVKISRRQESLEATWIKLEIVRLPDSEQYRLILPLQVSKELGLEENFLAFWPERLGREDEALFRQMLSENTKDTGGG